MFVPQSPLDQRKRQLIAKMAGARGKGGAGGGFKVGRPAGAGFGRGLGFGAAGGQGQRSQGIPQMLAGYGQSFAGGNQEFGQGAQDTFGGGGQAPVGQQFQMGGDMMGPADFGRQTAQASPARSLIGQTPSYSSPVSSGLSGLLGGSQTMQPALNPQLLQQLLGGYGQAPAPQMPSGFGTRYF